MAKAATVCKPFGKSCSSNCPRRGLANHLPFLNILARTSISMLELQPTQGGSCVPVAALCFWMSFGSCCVWTSEALGLAGAVRAKGHKSRVHICMPAPAWVKTGVGVLLFVEEKRLEFLFLLFFCFHTYSLLRITAISPLACPPPAAWGHHFRLQLEL